MLVRRAFAALACLFVLVQAPVVWAGGASPRGLDPQRVAWGDLRYTAHNLGIWAAIEVRLASATLR